MREFTPFNEINTIFSLKKLGPQFHVGIFNQSFFTIRPILQSLGVEGASSNSVDCEENKQLGLESSQYQNIPSELYKQT